MLSPYPIKRVVLFASLLFVAALAMAACGATSSAAPTGQPSVRPSGTSVPPATNVAQSTPTPTPVPTVAPPTNPALASPDWTKLGFPTVLTTQDLAAGAAGTIKGGPYTLQVPAGAFSDPVKVELLNGDSAHFAQKAPTGETPIFVFALNILDIQTNLLYQDFNQPLQLTVSDPAITGKVKFYNVGPDGTYGPDPVGLQVSNGQLTHPLVTAGVGHVITAPKP